MFHLVPYWCIRRTQYIPRFGGVLQCVGILIWRVEVEGIQFFHETRLQFLLSLTPLQILILIVSLGVLSYVSGQVYLTL